MPQSLLKGPGTAQHCLDGRRQLSGRYVLLQQSVRGRVKVIGILTRKVGSVALALGGGPLAGGVGHGIRL